jgi:general secretion pathway protein M
MTPAGWLTDWRARFAALSPRRQGGLLWAALLTALLLVLAAGVWPALSSWRASAQAHQRMAAQLHEMQGLQARARALRDTPQLTPEQALQQLQALTLALGDHAQLSSGEQRVAITLRGLPAPTLAQWLASAREQAHAVPLQAQLSRSTEPGPALWSGTLVLGLPPR